MSTVRSTKGTHQNFVRCLRDSRQVWILLFSPTSAEEQPSTALMEQCTQLLKTWILLRSSWFIPAYNLTYAQEGMAVCSNFLLRRKVVHKKMNTHSYENPCLSNKQDFILYTEVAQVLINCEHQLSVSPQHNFQIIKKNGRGRERRWKERETNSQSWVQTDNKAEGWLKGIHNIKLMRMPLTSWRLPPHLKSASVWYTL